MRVLFLLLLAGCGAAPARPAQPIQWQPWDAATFARAAAQGRYLLVSVEARWCHWCHVMDAETFGDPVVQGLVADRYLAIKVDSDARPDLAERFRDYAWPATALFTPDARLVVALRGYRGPEVFAKLLREVAAGERAPQLSAPPGEPADFAALRAAGRTMLDAAYDPRVGGWGGGQKYPYFGPLEVALFRAAMEGDDVGLRQARQTGAGTALLLDPVDGGAFQYSLKGRWDRPHFEKIALVQGEVLAAFAALSLAEPQGPWGAHMEAVVRYLRQVMRAPGGGFYTSQDADLSPAVPGDMYYAMSAEARRAAGAPRVDKAVYADLNGRLITALVAAHRAGHGDALALARASWDAVPARADGGVDHGVDQADLRYLRDQAWWLRASVALYQATGEPQYLASAQGLAAFARAELKRPAGGFYAHTVDPAAAGDLAERRVPLVENGVLARGLLALHRLTDDDTYRADAEHALKAGTLPALRAAGRRGGEYLLALEELAAPYVKVSVVGPDDGPTQAFHDVAFRLPTPVRLVSLSRPETSEYPYPGKPAAYVCNAARCDPPVTDLTALPAAVRRFLARD